MSEQDAAGLGAKRQGESRFLLLLGRVATWTADN